MHEFSNTLIYTEPNFKLNLCSIVAAFLWKGKRNKMTGKTRKGEREKEGKELWIYKVSNCNLTITESRIQLNCYSAVICKNPDQNSDEILLLPLISTMKYLPLRLQFRISSTVSSNCSAAKTIFREAAKTNFDLQITKMVTLPLRQCLRASDLRRNFSIGSSYLITSQNPHLWNLSKRGRRYEKSLFKCWNWALGSTKAI